MLNESNRFESYDDRGVQIFRIKGDVTRLSRPIFESIQSAFANAVGGMILFVFDNKAYFNSEGLKILLDLLLTERKKERRFAIVGLSKHFKKIFKMVGIVKLAGIFDSVEEALEDLKELSFVEGN
jgi:anti-anti-sigma factor